MQIITLETAKLAKQKNYNYSFVQNDTYILRNVYNRNGDVIRKDFLDDTDYPACTQSELCKWLRDSYKCFFTIIPEFYKSGINFNVQVLFYNPEDPICSDEKSTGLYGDNGEFQTYEEALEFGLQTALKLI